MRYLAEQTTVLDTATGTREHLRTSQAAHELAAIRNQADVGCRLQTKPITMDDLRVLIGAPLVDRELPFDPGKPLTDLGTPTKSSLILSKWNKK